MVTRIWKVQDRGRRNNTEITGFTVHVTTPSLIPRNTYDLLGYHQMSLLSREQAVVPYQNQNPILPQNKKPKIPKINKQK